MATKGHIYGEVDSKSDLEDVFVQIRKDVDDAISREALTELHRRAGYLITLAQAPSWEEKFGRDIGEMRRVAEDEFARTARKINQRAAKIGVEGDYDEKWGR